MGDQLSPASGNRLLATLSPADFAFLAPHLKALPTKLGAVLQQEGEPVEHVYFPLEGMISLVAIMKGGWGVETVTVGREGAVGAAVGFGGRSATTRATIQAQGTMLRIGASEFQKAASQSDAIRGMILENSETMLAQSQRTTACNTAHNLPERMARWLLQTQDRVGGDTLPLTQEFLSEMLGVRRTSVTLVAQQLQNAGAIQTRRGRIKVLDRHKLEELACECYEIIRRNGEGALSRFGQNELSAAKQ
jgi:CRP-like cAMP-binding protein